MQFHSNYVNIFSFAKQMRKLFVDNCQKLHTLSQETAATTTLTTLQVHLTYNNISGQQQQQQQTAILSYQTCKSHTRSTFSALWQLLLLPTAATRSAINFISKVALFGYLSRAAVRYYIQYTVRSADWPINLATRKVQSAAVRRMIYGRLSLRGLVLVLFQQLN